MIYEIRGSNPKTMYTAVLSVLDRMGIRLNVVERESIEGFERMVFSVPAARSRHAELLRQLQASSAAEQVVVFRDSEEE
jgi:putative Mg2+ transporter-C (MgtC) family protein